MLSLVIVIFFYFILLYSAYINNKSVFVGTLILLCCLYDYLFIEIGYTLPSTLTTLLKPFQELIILIGCFIILLTRKKIAVLTISFKERLLVLYVFIPFIISIFSSIINGFEINVLITGFRCFFVPILCAYILTYNGPTKIKPCVFKIISILIVVFAIYQVLSFSGSLNELWVYKSKYDTYGENEMDKAFYNYIKDDSLRAISFFVTPIDFSVSSAACALFFFSRYYSYKELNAIIYFMISVTGIILSQTRIGLFALIIGIAIILYLKNTRFANKVYLILLPIIMILFTLTFIFIVGDLDLSALGRLTQYADFGQSFTILGKGLGDQSGVFDYDSFVLCCMNLFGVSGILYLAFFVFLFSRAINIYNIGHKDDFTIFTLSLSSSMIYIFGFHHIAGSFVYWLIILLLFNMISVKRVNSNFCILRSHNSKQALL